MALNYQHALPRTPHISTRPATTTSTSSASIVPTATRPLPSIACLAYVSFSVTCVITFLLLPLHHSACVPASFCTPECAMPNLQTLTSFCHRLAQLQRGRMLSRIADSHPSIARPFDLVALHKPYALRHFSQRALRHLSQSHVTCFLPSFIRHPYMI